MSPADPARPRVAVLGQGWFPDDPGGLNRYVRDLLEAFAADGEPLPAVVLGPAADAPANVTVAADAADPMPQRIRHFHAAAACLAREADVIDAHFALYGMAPLLLGPARRRGRVVHFHGPWAQESALMHRGGAVAQTARSALERTVYRSADQVIVLSKAFGQLVVERFGVSPDRVNVIAPGVDLARFSPGSRADARTRLGLPLDVPIAVCVRRLDPRMGLLVLLDAWAAIVDELPIAPLLVIAGEGDLRAELERRAARLGESVRVIGRVAEEELPLLYRAADVSVVPSLALEGFGLVTLESLACGTPVIASDVDGLPEALDGFAADAIIAPGDATALATRLTGALGGDRPLPARAACRAHAERFAWKTAVMRHREVYARVAVRGRRHQSYDVRTDRR